ncbi:TonB-dependent receptor SusC [termite gut metagenome]|uniref:TonB-dependent receptor SusC n=1 Tax=termite gut metagenome TaxID=433724 RepID=A0A5J4RRK2_9ZZZZ
MKKYFFNEQLIKSYMHKNITCVFILFSLLCSTTVFSQNIAISGAVTDTSGEILIGVNVSVKGTTNGTITGIDGKYSLQQVPAQAVIVFSYVE